MIKTASGNISLSCCNQNKNQNNFSENFLENPNLQLMFLILFGSFTVILHCNFFDHFKCDTAHYASFYSYNSFGTSKNLQLWYNLTKDILKRIVLEYLFDFEVCKI